MNRSLTDAQTGAIAANLSRANEPFNALFPGESPARQPVHTVYGGAQIFRAETARKLGEAARAALKEYAPTAGILANALGIEGTPTYRARLYARIVEKLRREPVEDFRIDFEDGYGNRPDAEEDGHAVSASSPHSAGSASSRSPRSSRAAASGRSICSSRSSSPPAAARSRPTSS
jgi:hypothetical protein